MFYAAADAADRSNGRAKAVLGAGEPLVTSDHVLAESWILIRHRLGRQAAMRFWEAIRDERALSSTSARRISRRHGRSPAGSPTRTSRSST